jgi:hypothetical protein
MAVAKYINFTDHTGQRCRYMYPDIGRSGKPAKWVCVLVEGEWRPIRKANNQDIAAINQEVVKAHHCLD